VCPLIIRTNLSSLLDKEWKTPSKTVLSRHIKDVEEEQGLVGLSLNL
jgi:hypothetical protein